MASLADTLLITPRTPTASGDVLWKHADLERVPYAAVIPGTELVDELLNFKAAGSGGERLARLIPGFDHVAKMCAHPSKTIRSGVVSNPLTTNAQLTRLANDPDTGVADAAKAEIVRRDALRVAAHADDRDAAERIFDEFIVEEIRHLVDTQPWTAARALISINTANLLGRLEVLDADLVDELCESVLATENCPIPAAVARWACNGSERATIALHAALGDTTGRRTADRSKTSRRRLTANAESILVEAGHLPAREQRNQPPIRVSIDEMADILDTQEIAAMYFSSTQPVSDQTVERILVDAPPSMVVNHLVGQTMRKPEPGQIRNMLRASSPERRAEVASLIETAVSAHADTGESSPVAALPWIGELLLGCRRARVGQLGSDSASELYTSIDETLNGDVDAWEYLMSLSEEWEATILDLVQSAAAMEGITANLSS